MFDVRPSLGHRQGTSRPPSVRGANWDCNETVNLEDAVMRTLAWHKGHR